MFGISWKDLSVWSQKKIPQGVFRRQKVERVRLLDSVSGYARAGSMTAIMGASGAGKTTLLAALSGRASNFEMEGEVLLNGCPVDIKHILSISEFMPQHDLTIEGLTVLEHMQFMARLKVDVRVSEVERNRIIDNAISEVGLCRSKLSQLRFLSGGERRRVALAVHLLKDLPILFCDEPTTGLDSFNASGTISLLSKLAKRGKTVVFTIHQPGSGVFESFDETILMASGGRVAFQGSNNDALDHFKALGMVCPDAYNTAEFLISQLSTREAIRTEEDVRDICERFRTSKAYETFQRNAFEVNAARRDIQIIGMADGQLPRFSTWQGPGLSTQFKILLWRQGLSLMRDTAAMRASVIASFATGFLVAILCRGALFDQHSTQNVEGIFSFILQGVNSLSSYKFLNIMNKEIPVLLRETKENVYSVGPYYLSRIMLAVVQCSIETFVYSTTVYWVAGFSAGGLDFLLFVALLATSAILSTAIGCSFSSIFKSIGTASVVLSQFNQISQLFTGIFLNTRSLPLHLQWLKYVSRHYYGLEALSILQWTSVDQILCSETPDDEFCPATADQVLAEYGFKRSHLLFDFGGLISMFVIFVVAGYYGLKCRTKQQAYY